MRLDGRITRAALDELQTCGLIIWKLEPWGIDAELVLIPDEISGPLILSLSVEADTALRILCQIALREIAAKRAARN